MSCANRWASGRRRSLKQALDYIVLVTTDLSMSGRWIVTHYEARPEVEQDYEQLKSGGWLLKKLSSTRYSQIVFYLLARLRATHRQVRTVGTLPPHRAGVNLSATEKLQAAA